MAALEIVVPSRLVARPGYQRTGRQLQVRNRRISQDGVLRYIDHHGFEHVWRDERGPWYASISCASVPNEGRIHKPFLWDGQHYVSMGGLSPSMHESEICGGRCQARGVVPLADWQTSRWGRPTTYHQKVGPDGGAAARRDPRGIYHRMTAKCGQETWVFLGPPVSLVADDNPRLTQLTMFHERIKL